MKIIINSIWWWGGFIGHSVWYSRTYDVSGWELLTDFSLRWFLTLLPLLVLIALGQYVSIRIYNRLTQSVVDSLDDKEVDELLQGCADEVNQTCPQVIDAETCLDAAIAGPGRNFAYLYTLTGSVKLLQQDEFISAMRPGLLNSYQNLEEMETFRQIGAELSYVYRLEDGEEFARIALSPKDFTE